MHALPKLIWAKTLNKWTESNTYCKLNQLPLGFLFFLYKWSNVQPFLHMFIMARINMFMEQVGQITLGKMKGVKNDDLTVQYS